LVHFQITSQENAVDIDSNIDFSFAEFLMKNQWLRLLLNSTREFMDDQIEASKGINDISVFTIDAI